MAFHGLTNLTSITLLSFNQIAINGIQKKEWIDIETGFENINNNGLLFVENINPFNFEKKLIHFLTSMFINFSFCNH